MANLAQLVNAIAPVVTSPAAVALQPIYYPLLLHATTALDIAADVHVTGPTVSPAGVDDNGRWGHRISDLGPFTMVDAAATVSAARDRLAVTLVNRNPCDTEAVDIVPRDLALADDAVVNCVTAERTVSARAARALPDVEGACLERGSQQANGATLSVTLPPQSFTVIEAPMRSLTTASEPGTPRGRTAVRSG